MKYVFILILTIFSSIINSKEFIVGVENINYYPHYDFTNKKQSGYIYDLLELFSKKNNHKFTFVVLPIKRLRKQLLETNEIDFMYPDNPIWEQFHSKLDNKVYSDAIVFALGGTLVKTENLGKGSYYVKSLSVPHGFTPTEWLKIKKQRSLKIMAVKNAEAALALVIKGRVDAADVEFNVAQQLLEKLGSQNAVKLDPDLPFINVAFKLSTVNHISTINEFNIFLSEHKDEIKRLKQKYNLIESVVSIQ